MYNVHKMCKGRLLLQDCGLTYIAVLVDSTDRES